MKTHAMTLAIALGFSVTPPALLAAEDTKPRALDPTPMAADPAQRANDPAVAARQKAHTAATNELKRSLIPGNDKAFYRQKLEKMGFAITAVNSDDENYLEYEVIKNGLSYEVQVDFKNGKANKVDIANNYWKAKGTKEALSNKEYQYVYPAGLTANPELSSDRMRGKEWTDKKGNLEKELGVGHDRAYYRKTLESLGYQVTSTNDNEPDELELEVVKGDTSYEVKVDFDKKTKKSTRVNVDLNLWESDATEKAKGEG